MYIYIYIYIYIYTSQTPLSMAYYSVIPDSSRKCQLTQLFRGCVTVLLQWKSPRMYYYVWRLLARVKRYPAQLVIIVKCSLLLSIISNKSYICEIRSYGGIFRIIHIHIRTQHTHARAYTHTHTPTYTHTRTHYLS